MLDSTDINIFAEELHQFMGFVLADDAVVVGIELLELHAEGSRIHFLNQYNIIS